MRLKASLNNLLSVAKRSPAPIQRYPHVNVFEWRPKTGAINFGDHLSTVIVDAMLASRQRHQEEQVAVDRRLFAVGSVLHFARDGDVVWGSGINGKIPETVPYPSTLDVRAVRGPKTARFLEERGIVAPKVYGDPALLLPTLFGNRFKVVPKVPVVFVPNLHDLGRFSVDFPVISPLQGWNWVVDRILEAELVIATSLHGLIVAEAFGIPARYARLTKTEALFKYDDYAQGTGRSGIDAASSIYEAVEMGGLPPIRFDPEPLLQAFPWDLWH